MYLVTGKRSIKVGFDWNEEIFHEGLELISALEIKPVEVDFNNLEINLSSNDFKIFEKEVNRIYNTNPLYKLGKNFRKLNYECN